jgi:hypothetical protein
MHWDNALTHVCHLRMQAVTGFGPPPLQHIHAHPHPSTMLCKHQECIQRSTVRGRFPWGVRARNHPLDSSWGCNYCCQAAPLPPRPPPPTPGPCGRPAHTNHVHIQLNVQCLYLTCLSEVGLYRTATLPAENATRPAAEPRPLPESTLLPMTRSSRMTDCMGEVHSVHGETFNTSRVLGVYR